MQSRAKPSPRLEPLPIDHSPDLNEHFQAVGKNLGFVPNLIMQRKPKMVRAFAEMAAAIWGAAHFGVEEKKLAAV